MLINIYQRNKYILDKFISQDLPQTFRYFQTRNSSCIVNHKVTLMYVYDGEPVGYGHLDEDGGVFWLGVCVLSGYQGRGIGSYLISSLIKRGRVMGIKSISLTVDICNNKAFKLYQKFGFRVLFETRTYKRMDLSL